APPDPGLHRSGEPYSRRRIPAGGIDQLLPLARFWFGTRFWFGNGGDHERGRRIEIERSGGSWGSYGSTNERSNHELRKTTLLDTGLARFPALDPGRHCHVHPWSREPAGRHARPEEQNRVYHLR